MNSFSYLFHEGINNIRENKLMSLASVGVLVTCMILLGASLLFGMNINEIMGNIEDMNEVVVYIADDADEEETEALGESIKAMDNVLSIQLITKEQALLNQMEILEEASGLLSGLAGDENPLPASYRIKIDDLSRLNETTVLISNLPNVQKISAPTQIAKTLVDIKSGVTVAGGVIVGLLAMVSIIIISNTVKVTIFNRRKEISVMKYVGATDSFIRIPFMVEGLVIGMLSALLAFAVLWLSYEAVARWFLNLTLSLPLGLISFVSFTSVWYVILGTLILAGFLFGCCGSLFFVNKYLKV